ncbi:TPA: helix-turn-helix transcriptional regulator [Streptococcus suis]|uniref:helix-turn-helix transcriptional regulator n=1 Tax=Streptococcus TaxID=1301 RepID=UPI001331BC90|nr:MULTISPECIES: helix-turn-helix transcriptional regulator [Streptococcus]KAF1107605.1 transcriptional regulator [Streptococcus agalactiae]KAF1138566.1 transcriptional regulator [Streptococcus agalactiae]KAF1143582.1 transcriptional regulator [Streptococcus agalactiae]KAF1146052.1 transcriptional regulator [Streptococcus agalactiae]KAF1167036.1 transcriptional regulator [Streptococcus agalactiae]
MKLKELRQAKGMTRVQLSKAIDVRVRTIAPWENGESDMFLKTAIMLSTYFNVTLDEFISL